MPDTSLTPYSGPQGECPKCRSRERVLTTYHRGGGRPCSTLTCTVRVTGDIEPIVQEHFLRYCRNCRFEWVEGMPAEEVAPPAKAQLGEPVTLRECPPGAFAWRHDLDGQLYVGFKSEYGNNRGVLDVYNEAGEYHGGRRHADTFMVWPLDIHDLVAVWQ